MKTKELEKILTSNGFQIIRYSKHIIWSNGKQSVAIPHQKEQNKILTKHILKLANIKIAA
jgi:predicted RNA binding protein YcfA (HicA-like mRNA interferase family)